jgi:hypothetical protein
MPDPRLDFPFAIGILDSARQCNNAVMIQNVLEQWIDRRLVDIGRSDTFLEVVQND